MKWFATLNMKRKALYTLPNEVREQRGLDFLRSSKKWGFFETCFLLVKTLSANGIPFADTLPFDKGRKTRGLLNEIAFGDEITS